MLEELLHQNAAEANNGTIKAIPRIWDGIILETATAQSDQLTVALPGADKQQHIHGPCPFMPRGQALPQAGDQCLVAFDDDDDPWIIAWSFGEGVSFGPIVIDTYIHQDAVYDNGDSGATPTIDWKNGNYQKIRMTANATFTFVDPAGPGSFTLRLLQDSTGGRVATWPAAVKWPGGTVVPLSVASGAYDLFVFQFWSPTEYNVNASKAYA
jgi:hypothetical protein